MASPVTDKRLPDCEGIETRVRISELPNRSADKRLPDCEGIETYAVRLNAAHRIGRQEAARL